MKIKREDFKLKKFKRTEAGLQIGFQELMILGNGVKSTSGNLKTYKEDPHPDLVDALEAFEEIVMYDEDYKADAEIKITGVNVFPDIEMGMITHLKTTKSGKTARNSGRIPLESETFKLAQKFFDMIDILENEVYEFVYLGKRAQLALFENDDFDFDVPVGENGITGKLGPVGIAGKTKEELEDEGVEWNNDDLEEVIAENKKKPTKKKTDNKGKIKAKTSTKKNEGMKVA